MNPPAAPAITSKPTTVKMTVPMPPVPGRVEPEVLVIVIATEPLVVLPSVAGLVPAVIFKVSILPLLVPCLLYTSDAADDIALV